jgi:hypothetical protein
MGALTPKGGIFDVTLFAVCGEMEAVVPAGARFRAFESELNGLIPIEPEGIRFVMIESFICGAEESRPENGLLIPIPLSS